MILSRVISTSVLYHFISLLTIMVITRDAAMDSFPMHFWSDVGRCAVLQFIINLPHRLLLAECRYHSIGRQNKHKTIPTGGDLALVPAVWLLSDQSYDTTKERGTSFHVTHKMSETEPADTMNREGTDRKKYTLLPLDFPKTTRNCTCSPLDFVDRPGSNLQR